jgi:DNA-binding NtrC family response regulator
MGKCQERSRGQGPEAPLIDKTVSLASRVVLWPKRTMSTSERRTILYLEDQPDLLKGWSRLLTLAGFDVRPCQNLEQALTAIQADDLSAVLCDFQLQNNTSLPLIVRARTRQPPLPVVLMTGNPERAERELANVGITVPVLAKPATLASVILLLGSS